MAKTKGTNACQAYQNEFQTKNQSYGFFNSHTAKNAGVAVYRLECFLGLKEIFLLKIRNRLLRKNVNVKVGSYFCSKGFSTFLLESSKKLFE
jgi:hypothetical protein